MLLRQYLLTLVVLTAGSACGWPGVILLASVATAALIDFLVISRSTELALYRKGLDFDALTRPGLSWDNALRLQCAAAVASACVALFPRAFDAGLTMQQPFNVVALLIGGAAASYCGFGMITLAEVTPRELLNRSKIMPLELFVLELLPPRASTLMGGVANLFLSVLPLAPFPWLLSGLHTIALTLPIALIALVLSIFFQIGFSLLAQGLFSLRWWRRGDEQTSQQT